VTIEFNPTFKHTDWIDNQDRVTAGGDNGFNRRFQNLVADFTQLSQLFKTVGDTIAVLQRLQVQQVEFAGSPETTVSVPAGTTATPGVVQVPLGQVAIGSHSFFLVSVRPITESVAITWQEQANTPLGSSFSTRRLLLANTDNNPASVAVKAVRVEFDT
jgi:hypothetical protein